MKLIRPLKPFSNIHPIWEHWNHICFGSFSSSVLIGWLFFQVPTHISIFNKIPAFVFEAMHWDSLLAQSVENLPAVQETQV